jgi:adenylate cyclase
MAAEIERKFLVSGSSWMASVSKTRIIRQAYISKNERVSVRVRIDSTSGATLTIKTTRSGPSRLEYEYRIPTQDAEELFLHGEGAVVQKVRHEVALNGLVWEVDVFAADNAGLVIAEVELESADQAFARPVWLGQEVTDDARFYSANLAAHPFSRWQTRP